MPGLTLDAGALIALECKDERMNALLERMLAQPEAAIHVPAAVLAQVFRDGSRQVRLMRLFRKPQTCVVALEEETAYAVGVLLGLRSTRDVVDASVVLCARRYRQPIVTTDPEDLRRLDAKVELHAL